MKQVLKYLVVGTILIYSCSKDDIVLENEIKTPDSQNNNWQVINDTSYLGAVSLSSLYWATKISGYPQFNKYLKYSIQVYKISYHTTFKGLPIIASGVISLPQNINEKLPVMIVGSGLTFADHQAPSEFSFPSQFSGYEFIAALGYITYIPDLIGYGDSRNLPSTFYNKEYSIKAVTDFILAANEFIENLNILTNQQYYITGYSQGGFIVLATLQAIEEGVLNIEIKAAAIGAGGYNLYDLVRNNLNRETYAAPSHFAIFFSSYNEINEWERPMTDFFNNPYASRIKKLISGSFTRQEADNFLTNCIEILINPKFKENTLSGNEKQLIDALEKNSIQCWASKTPLRIYHSLNDEIIPYTDSENIYSKMKLAGSENVELIQLTGNTHYQSGLDFVEKVIQWYSTL